MEPADRALLAEALRFALEAHGCQKRKGTEIPYVSHLLRVSGIVLEHGGDAEQAAAGLLHDTIEDCGVSEADLRQRFGGEVARIVRACSDVIEGEEPGDETPWEVRKKRYLEHLREVDDRTRLVSACDKLDNLRSMVTDLHADGPATLARFKGRTPEQILWYYRGLRSALGCSLPRRLVREIDVLTDEMARLAAPGASGAGR